MPETAASIFATLARHERHQQRLVHGLQAFTREWLRDHGAEDPALACWLAAQIKVSTPVKDSGIPAGLRLQADGWDAYYAGQYGRAAAEFAAAWSYVGNLADGDGQIAEIALGLGKVYTRTGHWEAARAWLLVSLATSRGDERLVGVMQGYGALGELFLRSGAAEPGHACMSIAYHVMPPGSGQQAKQLNFLASTLMRTGALLRAESLLMTALHIATDQGDIDSAWHALARLQFLELDRRETGVEDVLVRLARYVPTRSTAVASGFAHVGRALRQHASGCRSEAHSSLDQATADFGEAFPCERAWAQRLLEAMGGPAYRPAEDLCAFLHSRAIVAPPLQVVLDHSWAEVKIAATNGFAWLLQPCGTVAEEALRRECFFI